MRLVTFKTPKPKQFKYAPRYYDPEKEKLEKRKAALGLDSELSHDESLRMQMERRWRKNNVEEQKSGFSSVIRYTIYGAIIFGSIYLIMFTEFVERFLQAFGVTH